MSEKPVILQGTGISNNGNCLLGRQIGKKGNTDRIHCLAELHA